MTFESGLTKPSDFPVPKIHLSSSDIDFKGYPSAFHAVSGANVAYENKGYLNTLRLENSGRDVGQYQDSDVKPGHQVAYKTGHHKHEHGKHKGHHKGGGQTDTAENSKDDDAIDFDDARNDPYMGGFAPGAAGFDPEDAREDYNLDDPASSDGNTVSVTPIAEAYNDSRTGGPTKDIDPTAPEYNTLADPDFDSAPTEGINGTWWDRNAHALDVAGRVAADVETMGLNELGRAAANEVSSWF